MFYLWVGLSANSTGAYFCWAVSKDRIECEWVMDEIFRELSLTSVAKVAIHSRQFDRKRLNVPKSNLLKLLTNHADRIEYFAWFWSQRDCSLVQNSNWVYKKIYLQIICHRRVNIYKRYFFVCKWLLLNFRHFSQKNSYLTKTTQLK